MTDSLLGMTVIGAMVSSVAALGAIALKDHFFYRQNEKWKQKRDLEVVYQKFRDPVLLATHELASRLEGITRDGDYPPDYLAKEVLESTPTQQTLQDTDDPYFKRHRMITSLFRISSFLGWLELYRQETTFLSNGNTDHTGAVANVIAQIRYDFSEGNINNHSDWQEWHDVPIFSEEMRAIGETMIEMRGSIRSIMGYAQYHGHITGQSMTPTKRWSNVIAQFLFDLAPTKDFRRERMQRVLVHLVELIRLLDPQARIEKGVLVLYEEIRPTFEDFSLE